MNWQTSMTLVDGDPMTQMERSNLAMLLKLALAAIHCEHSRVSMYTTEEGEEHLYCLDCLKDLRGELPDLTCTELADQLSNVEE